MRCRGRRPRRPVTRPRFVPGMIQWRWLPICHCEEAAGRRGNLAGPGWITGQLRRIRKLVREIATGAKRPRNDNSEVHTILTMACTDRQHCAGPGCPLPYNGVYGRREYPEICSCQWRSLPVKGTPLQTQSVFTFLSAPCTNWKCLPEIATSLRSSQ